MLRFDGLYVGPPKTSKDGFGPYFDYLRFYKDGWVINCVSLGTPREVVRWFYRDNPAQTALLKGRFDLQGDRISFSPEFRDMDEGEEMVIRVDYQGRITENGDALELTVSSSQKPPGAEEMYRFAAIEK